VCEIVCLKQNMDIIDGCRPTNIFLNISPTHSFIYLRHSSMYNTYFRYSNRIRIFYRAFSSFCKLNILHLLIISYRFGITVNSHIEFALYGRISTRKFGKKNK
jgi:hypothetical protein